jgi:hypothetical protein
MATPESDLRTVLVEAFRQVEADETVGDFSTAFHAIYNAVINAFDGTDPEFLLRMRAMQQAVDQRHAKHISAILARYGRQP